MTRDDVLAYLTTLPDDLQLIYKKADEIVITAPDTLEDSFQIACDLREVFERRALAWKMNKEL